MKSKLIILVAVFTFMTLPAQEKGRPEFNEAHRPTREQRAQRLAEHLSLTDSQKDKLIELFKKEEVKMQALKSELKSKSENREKESGDQKTKFESMRNAHDAELEKIIGKENMEKLRAERVDKKEQFKEFAKMHGNLHRKMNAHGACDGENVPIQMRQMLTPERRAQMLKEELQLTDSQQLALIEIFKQQEKKIREEHKILMERIKTENDTELEKIIGKDKMVKLKEVRDSHKK